MQIDSDMKWEVQQPHKLSLPHPVPRRRSGRIDGLAYGRRDDTWETHTHLWGDRCVLKCVLGMS